MSERPRQPPEPDRRPPKNAEAVASLILGIAGLFVLPVVGAVLALILGTRSRREIKEAGGSQRGDEYARAGIIAGAFGLVWGLALVGVAGWFSFQRVTTFAEEIATDYERASTGNDGPVVPDPAGCDRIDQLIDESNVPVRPAFARSRQLEGSLLQEVPAEYQPYADFSMSIEYAAKNHANPGAWQRSLGFHHFVRGWKKVWLRGEGEDSGNVMTEVVEFRATQDANRFQEEVSSETCDSALETFEVPGLPGSYGARFAFGDGRVVDQASYVVRNRRYVLLVGSTGGLPDRRLLFRLMQSAAPKALHPGDVCGADRRLIELTLRRQEMPPTPLREDSWEPATELGYRPMGTKAQRSGLPEAESVTTFDRRRYISSTLELVEWTFADPNEAKEWFLNDLRRRCSGASAIDEHGLRRGTMLTLESQTPEIYTNTALWVRGSHVYRFTLQGHNSPDDHQAFFGVFYRFISAEMPTPEGLSPL